MVRRRLSASAFVVFTAFALVGCASTSPASAVKDVRGEVERRAGKTVRWNQSSDDDREAERAVDRLLAKDLTADAAVQIALLASPSLQAKLEELSISQADLVQAGMLKNPTFGVGITAWEQEHIDPNLFATVEQDFLDLVTLPLRKRVAAAELEATKLEVGDHVLELAAEVRTAFFAAQAAEQVAAMRRLVDEAASTSGELAKRQHEAGNMNDLALGNELSLAAQAKLDRRRAEGEAAVARERVNKLLGLWGKRTAWRAGPKLPELPSAEPPLAHLESRAVAERLDLAASRRNVQSLGYALGLAKTTRWFGTVNVAVEAGRLRHNKKLSFGPAWRSRSAVRSAPGPDREARGLPAPGDARAPGARRRRARGRARLARACSPRAASSEDYGKVVVPLREGVVRASQERMRRHAARRLPASRPSRPSTRRTASTSRRCATTGSRGATSSAPSADSSSTPRAPRPRAAKNATKRRPRDEDHVPARLPGARRARRRARARARARGVAQPRARPGAVRPRRHPQRDDAPFTVNKGVKEFRLVAEPVKREFAKGMVVNAWGYNGSTPGPTIEAVEGDRVRFYVTNKLPERTSVHWHGILLPNGQDGVAGLNQPHIEPGETYVYEFTLRQHGVFMYHPHSDEMVQMAMGMSGVLRHPPARARDAARRPALRRDVEQSGTSSPARRHRTRT